MGRKTEQHWEIRVYTDKQAYKVQRIAEEHNNKAEVFQTYLELTTGKPFAVWIRVVDEPDVLTFLIGVIMGHLHSAGMKPKLTGDRNIELQVL